MLSPDGKRVIVRVARNGKQQLAIIPLGDAANMKLLDPGNMDMIDWRWVNNDWAIVRAGQMQSVEGNDWYMRRAFGVKADGSKINALTTLDTAQNADDILWIAHDGSPHIRIAEQMSIYSDNIAFWPEVRDFDVSTGRSTRVQMPTANVMDWYADTAGTVRLGIAYDDDKRSYRALYRDHLGAPLTLVGYTRGANASLGTLPALMLPQSGKAVAIDDGSGFDAVYDFDLTTMKASTKLFDVPDYDIDQAIVDPAGTKLIGYRYTDARQRTKWIDPGLAKTQDDLDKALPNENPTIESWSDDLSVLLVRVGAADTPGAYYVFRSADRHLRILAKLNEALGQQHFAPVHTVHLKARDGVEMAAVLTLPKGKEAKNLPLILMPHGGPFARDDEEWDWRAQFLASRGYAVLQPNYRGSSGFGTKFAKLGEGQWGLKMQDDLTDAVGWAAKQGIADPARVCIVGASYGGYAAFRAAQRDKGVYRCAVSYAGVSDMAAMVRYDSSFLNGGRSKDYLRLQAPDLKAVSPINFASDFSTPILMPTRPSRSSNRARWSSG